MSKNKTVILDETIMQKNRPATAGSKILEGFTAPFDATVAERLADYGYEIAGRSAGDEFNISGLFSDIQGSTNETGVSDISGNVFDAVKSVADGNAEFFLCNDLFGKYRRIAAECGCYCIRPTYGTVSRYGLIPSASSMDQIGVVCRNLSDGFELLSRIAGNDPRDGAMYPESNYLYEPADIKITLAIPGNVIEKADGPVREAIRNFSENFTTVQTELEYFDVYKQVMYILSCAEFCANVSRYDGIKFGYRAVEFIGLDDLYYKTRSEGFGPEAKLATVMGSAMLSQKYYLPFYEKAMKLRRLIKESLRFGEYDALALPCKINGDAYENLSLYSLACLAGLPSVSFMYNGQAIQLIADVKNENILYSAAMGFAAGRISDETGVSV